MKSNVWLSLPLATCAFGVLAGDAQVVLPAFVEVDVRYSELRGECAGDRFFVAIIDSGDGRHSGSIADERGKPVYQGAPVHTEGCGADAWPQRTDAFEKLGMNSRGESVVQLAIPSGTSKSCRAVLDLPAVLANICAPPDPGVPR